MTLDRAQTKRLAILRCVKSAPHFERVGLRKTPSLHERVDSCVQLMGLFRRIIPTNGVKGVLRCARLRDGRGNCLEEGTESPDKLWIVLQHVIVGASLLSEAGRLARPLWHACSLNPPPGLLHFTSVCDTGRRGLGWSGREGCVAFAFALMGLAVASAIGYSH